MAVEESIRFARENVFVNAHSSVRLACTTATGEERIVYVDPYLVDGAHGVAVAPHDADIICITHSHYDHFSPEDIQAVAREDGATRFVLPRSMREEALVAKVPGLTMDTITVVVPGSPVTVLDVPIRATSAYNAAKPFHPREKLWVGSVVEATPGVRVYVCGDTDANPDCFATDCDIICIPVGGKYTMNAPEASALVNAMFSAKGAPVVAIPTHYGSVTGTPADGETFAARVREGIEVVVPY